MEQLSWLSPESLRQAAGGRAFARGAEYHALGQVLSLAEYRGAVAAVVQGARRYDVLLRHDEHGIVARCNCPAADAGACCKHCVAAGLACLEQQRQGSQPVTLPVSLPPVSLDDVAAHLHARPHGELVALLLDESLENEALRQRLLLDAANHTGKRIEIASYLRAVELALSKAVWSEGEDAGIAYLIELKASLSRLADAGRWDDLQVIIAHARTLLTASKYPSPAASEKLRTFSHWLRHFPAEVPK